MSLDRLLRSERLARRSAPQEIELSFDEAVRLANEGRVIVWAPLPPPEPPAPQAPPSAEAKPTPTTAGPPQPEPPLQWWEERCRWRARTAADDYDDAEDTNEDDDPLGLYS